MVGPAAPVGADRRPQWREKALKDIAGLHQRTDTGHRRTVSSDQPRRRAGVRRCRRHSPATQTAGALAAKGRRRHDAADAVEAASGSRPAGRTTCSWPQPCCSRTATPRRAAAARRLLMTYAATAAAADGLFIHAQRPHAWGRGNGFALLGVTEALTHLPDRLQDRDARARRSIGEHVGGAGEAPIGRWQLAAGGRRPDELSRADGDGNDDGGNGARHLARLDRSQDL